MDKDAFRKQSGYVMQSDALFPLLTVRETIKYAAYLRCSGTVAEKDVYAENTIKLLRLDDCADTIVGDNDNRGISGGQKRRVSVAVDIIHSPSVIFLDEPTSGLDSSTAFSVIESLKELAASRGCTIVMTIHQPSARLFNLIDKVLFLANGRVTYNGAVSALTPFINKAYDEAKLGSVPLGNQPEIFLDLCDQLIVENRLELLTGKYEIKDTSVVGTNTEGAHQSYANSFFKEIAVLVSRGVLNVKRTPELFFARLGASTGFGVMIGTLFLFSENTLSGIQHKMSYFVFIVAFFYYTSLEALPIFLQERGTACLHYHNYI
jgi:ATP-binding cassette subfamily G (WHITE) protein 2